MVQIYGEIYGANIWCKYMVQIYGEIYGANELRWQSDSLDEQIM